MKIKRPAKLSGVELALVVALGVAGGVYIWKPLFTKPKESTEPQPSNSQ